MLPLELPHRPATRSDATAMAELVNMAGDGMPLYLWSKTAQGDESPWAIGEARARRESGGFSYRNTVVREYEGKVVAALIGYPLPFEPEPGVVV